MYQPRPTASNKKAAPACLKGNIEANIEVGIDANIEASIEVGIEQESKRSKRNTCDY